MKVSYQWLAEYIDIADYSAAELAEKLTRSGIEVDVVESRNKGIKGVVVGYVKEKTKHPDADKLNVCMVDVGQDEDLQIVCGAKNVEAGQKVPVAVVGAVLPGNFKIKKAKLRGVESRGMICSAKELGMNDKLLPKEQQEGILVLPSEEQVGTDILEVLSLSDEVMELDLTPNRSDCLSMLGVAFEIGAILGREVKLPNPEANLVETKTTVKNDVQVKIEAGDLCAHYAARYFENIQIKPSPLWLQNRLIASGIRPINNVVDITNFVMLEYGQPLHAFDAEKLEQRQIVVRRAKQGERLVTLDDQERELDEEMLLITDGTKPVAIAGVMGGANSEVTESTAKIVLESAKFDGSNVRKTSRKLGLRSEASQRFEKGVDPAGVIPALNRAAELLEQYAGAQVAQGIVQQVEQQREPIQLPLSLERVNQYLGTQMTFDELKQVFTRLKFPYEQAEGNQLLITVPTRRGDITRDVDLIEEAARLYGYDHIPTTLMTGVTTPGSLTREQKLRRIIRHSLTESGLYEAINYSFTLPTWHEKWPGAYDKVVPIRLAMPMSEERSVLRTSLIPHLIDTAQYNRNRNIDQVAIFEIGSVFLTKEDQLTTLPEEKSLLSMLWTGSRHESHWSYKSPSVDFYDVKGVLEQLFHQLGMSEHIQYRAASFEGMHPGRTASILWTKGEQAVEFGRIGQLHPQMQQDHDLEDTYVVELELSFIYEHASFDITYQSLPRYPAITRDIALVVDDSVTVGEIVATIKTEGGEHLSSVDVFDVFKGEKLGENKKSVALSLVYRDLERTLTDEEVTKAHGKIVQKLEENFQAELRK